MKLVIVIGVLLATFGFLNAGTLNRDEKTASEEDVYGDLDGDNGDVQKDQEDQYYDNTGDETPVEANTNDIDAKIISKSEIFSPEIGKVIRLPCNTSPKQTNLVRLWSKDSALIFQDTLNLANKKNMFLLPNGTLQVVIENNEDYGNYSCQLAVTNDVHPEVIHQVLQRSGAKITELFANENKTIYEIGDALKLTCKASGNPVPKISWYKNNEKLGTDGSVFTIQNLKPRHAGQYRCLADNSIGRPAHGHLEIFVKHSPSITIDKYLVNSNHESDAELVCEVKAYPSASVIWQKNGENLSIRNEKIIMKSERNNERNILEIKNLNDEDFGHYMCIATNNLGSQSKTVSLVKTPAIRNFEKPAAADSSKDVILQWKVESKQTVSEHELQYRKKGESNWSTITPEVTEGKNDVYTITQTIKNLDAGIYETRARSKNNHGWSGYSEIVPFQGVLAKQESQVHKPKHPKKELNLSKSSSPSDSIDKEIPAQHRSEEITSLGESTSSSSRTGVSIGLITIALVLVSKIRQ